MSGGFYRDLEMAALRWRHTILQSHRFCRRHPDSCIELRYEDLLAEPGKTARRLCDFLEVPFSREMLGGEEQAAEMGDVPAWFWHRQVNDPINPENKGKGRRYFLDSEKKLLDEWIGAELAQFGYPPCTD